MGQAALPTWPVATDGAGGWPARTPSSDDIGGDPASSARGRPPRRPGRAVLLAPVLLTLVSSLTVAPRTAVAATAPGAGGAAEADAERIYLADCASCHGDEGRGTNRGPSLVGVGKASTYYYLATGRMPIDEPDDKVRRQSPAYPPEMITALVDHVAGFGGGGPDVPHVSVESAELALGGKLYRAQCAACHTTAGGGGALLRQDAPPVYHAAPAETAAAIRVGPGTMPAFGEAALSDEELNDVVAYVDYLTRPDDRGGEPLWHLGPLIEGLVAWVFGLGLLVLLALWIGKAT